MNKNKLYSVPSEKLLLMSFSTGSYYCFYWLFKNWKAISDIRARPNSPLIRTVLYPIYIFSLLGEIKSLAKDKGLRIRWSPSLLGISYLLLLSGFFFPYTWVFSIFAGITFVPANNTSAQINEANGLEKDSQEGFDKLDWAIIIIGGINVSWAVLKTIMVSGILSKVIQ